MLNYKQEAATMVSSQSQTVLSVLTEARLLILRQLLVCGTGACGCELGEILGVPKNLLSYHLKALRGAGFVSEVKCGRKKQYTIAPEKRAHVQQLLEVTYLLTP